MMQLPVRKAAGAQTGFTLIELLLVIVVITVASVPLFTLFTHAATSLLSNEDIQTAAQLAQEKAEDILGQRRNEDFASVATGTFSEPGVYNGFNRSTVITQATSAPSACPTGIVCDEVVISVDKGGAVLAEVTLLLVDY
jgi:prepilin-type N-terminal cleavage/methylation domain-containing protein